MKTVMYCALLLTLVLLQSSEMPPQARQAILAKWRASAQTGRGPRFLVIFDVIVKPPEIPPCPLVVNFDLPRSVEGYAQRVAGAAQPGSANAVDFLKMQERGGGPSGAGGNGGNASSGGRQGGNKTDKPFSQLSTSGGGAAAVAAASQQQGGAGGGGGGFPMPSVVLNFIQAAGGDVEMLRSTECAYRFKVSRRTWARR